MKKERKLKNYLQTGILLFGISLLLWNCEKEDVFEIPRKKNTITTVSITKAKELFAVFKESKLLSKGTKQNFKFKPLWKTIKQEELSFTKAQLTNIEIEPTEKLN
jgi:hypothetical protein